MARLLATLVSAGQLSWPVGLIHRDRPDFLMLSGGLEIGIEVTESIPEQYAAYCALAEREFPDAMLEPSHFRWGSPPLTLVEMRTLLAQTRLSGEPWYGDSAEREWAQFILGSIQAKLAKLAAPEFQKFTSNRLAIYDNLPMPNIDLNKALAHLESRLASVWNSSPGFDTIYIEHTKTFVVLTPSATKQLPLNDLWAGF